MNKNKYNVAIIGGGPAGMIAAVRAGELGASVILLEKNANLGKKLLMTGKGRCNITTAESKVQAIAHTCGKNGRFLLPALNHFSNKDIVVFFEEHGLKTKVERGGRVFPVTDDAHDVLQCMVSCLRSMKVDIRCNSPVKNLCIDTDSGAISKIILNSGETIIADNYLLATGGKSYPETGSTGDAYAWLQQLGHTIVEPKPALTPIIVEESIVKKLEGLSLKNVEISLWNQRKLGSEFGEAIFTGNGLSGPIVLDLSKIVGENKPADLTLQIDLKPALDHPTLDKRIQRDFEEQKNRQFKNCLNKLLPQKLIPVIIALSGIDENKQVNEVTKVERKKIVSLLKELKFRVKGLVGFKKAIITSGGVDVKEVDPKTMRSKIIDNLYFGGELLDVDGPTGGYNLQIAWSTGYLAGENSVHRHP